jgi:hypothetical protein
MKLIDRHVQQALPRAFRRDYSVNRIGCKRRAVVPSRFRGCHALRTFISHGERAVRTAAERLILRGRLANVAADPIQQEKKPT